MYTSDMMHIIDSITGIEWQVKPETAAQFTGKKDKKDNDVYEDDIIIADGFEFEDYVDSGIPDSPDEKYKDCKAKVIYSGTMFCIETDHIGNVPLDHFDSKEIEIIGNIHSNPELYEKR
jgi:uncharacterized phage protein (TIGR01671 family)